MSHPSEHPAPGTSALDARRVPDARAERPAAGLRGLLVVYPRRTRIIGALVAAALFAAVYATADLTAWGQVLENGFATASNQSRNAAYIPYEYLRLPPLRFETPTIIVGTLVVLVVAATQRRWRELFAALVGVTASVLLGDGLASLLGRPHLDPAAPAFDLPASYPSGHLVIAAALSMGLLIVVPRSWLRWCAPIALGWTAMVASAVLALGWHRPSDVIGAALLVCGVYLAVTALFLRTAEPIRWRDVRAPVVVPIVVGLAAIMAIEPTLWHVPITALTSVAATAVVGVTALVLCRAGSPTPEGTIPTQGARVRNG